MTSGKRALVVIGVVLLCLMAVTGVWASEFNINFNDVDYADIYRALGESAGLNVLVDPAVQGKGTFQLKDVTALEAIDLVSKLTGFVYRLEGNTLIVGPAERLAELDARDIRYIRVQSVPVTDVLEALELVMPRTDVYVQPQSNLIILLGSRDVLDRAENLIATLDRSFLGGDSSEGSRSLLEIFKDLSAEMGLNLIADPSLQNRSLYLELRNQEPEEIIKQIQQLVQISVEITEHSLVVGAVADEGTERLKVYRLDYAEPDAARTALSMIVDVQRIQLDPERKSIIVRGTDAELAEVDLFLADFDQPLPQVVLEVWVQEIATEALQNLGVDWKGMPSFQGGTAPVFFELDWESWDLILALRVLEEQGDAKLLANPQVTTLSGQTANIFVGDRVPVVLDSPDGTRTIEFLESGINLSVTPRISDDDYITILVQPEVSTFIWRADTEYPQIRTREAETTVRVRSGQPFVLGGLLQEQDNETIKQIPFLSQLPLLGKLFQWKESKQTQTEMTIFLIPRIVKDGEGLVHKDFFPHAQ